MKLSKTLNDLIAHQKKFDERIHLVASENSLGMEARIAYLSDALNRYYFPLREFKHWAFPGNEYLEAIYKRCTENLRRLTGATYVNIRPISGINAMLIALASLTKQGDTIATLAPVNGGHAITSGMASRLGIRVKYIPYDQQNFEIDTEGLALLARKEKINLIYLDQAHVLFPPNVRSIKRSVPNANIYYDGSHLMGLIFGNLVPNPIAEGATFLGGNTHKTIPGPHKAFIATNDGELGKKINQFSHLFVSHDHPADVAALAIVLEEMKENWESYASQTVKNAVILAQDLDRKGFRVAGQKRGFTKTHQIWIDTEPHMDPYEAVLTLARCNVITNTINAPAFPGKLAIRIGVQEVTGLGATEKTIEAIAQIFEDAILKKLPEEVLARRTSEIKQSLNPLVTEDLFEKLHLLFTETGEK